MVWSLTTRLSLGDRPVLAPERVANAPLDVMKDPCSYLMACSYSSAGDRLWRMWVNFKALSLAFKTEAWQWKGWASLDLLAGSPFTRFGPDSLVRDANDALPTQNPKNKTNHHQHHYDHIGWARNSVANGYPEHSDSEQDPNIFWQNVLNKWQLHSHITYRFQRSLTVT